LGKEDREETRPGINPSATREAEENLKMDPSPFLLLWDQRNRLVAFDTWGAQEWVQLPFESDTGAEVIDAIGNAPNGAMFGDAQLVGESSPQEGAEYSIHLDGDGDYVSMGIQDAFDVQATGFSILAWIKPMANENMGIAAYGDPLPGQAGYALKYLGTSGSEKLQFVLSDGSGSAQTVTYNLPASLYNQWHHVAATVDPAGAIKLYLDGDEVQSATNQETGSFGDVTSAFTVGRVPGGIGTPVEFEGYIDDVRVAHTPFTALQIFIALDNANLSLENIRSVEYTYDDQNRLLSRVADLDGWVGPLAPTTDYYIHDGNQIVLRLDADGDVMNRYLWGPVVDQLLADEQVSNPASAGDVLWALTDNLGSVRDLVRFDDVEGVESVVHREYDSFGNVTKETNAVDVLFGFTGRQFDGATGLQNNLNRWYDASVGRWTSEDPIGFQAGDANFYRYVGNQVTSVTDPTGESWWNPLSWFQKKPPKKTIKYWPKPIDSAHRTIEQDAVKLMHKAMKKFKTPRLQRQWLECLQRNAKDRKAIETIPLALTMLEQTR
jgi:RHS repeat-associated protein